VNKVDRKIEMRKFIKCSGVLIALTVVISAAATQQTNAQAITVREDVAVQLANNGPATLGQMFGLDKSGKCVIDENYEGLVYLDVRSKVSRNLNCMEQQIAGTQSQAEQVQSRLFLASHSFSIQNMSRSPEEFFLERRIAFTYAGLQARKKIASQVNTQISGNERVEFPGTPEHAAFKGRSDALNQERSGLRRQYIELMQQADPIAARAAERELDAQTGPGFVDRLYALMDASIRNLDPTYDPDALADQSRAQAQSEASYLRDQLSQIKERGDRIKNQQASLDDEINKLSNEMRVSEGGSSMTELAFIGTAPVYSVEYYDAKSNSLHIGIVQAWSKNLEGGAIAAIEGLPVQMVTEDTPISTSKIQTVEAKIASLRLQDLIGPMRFVDGRGNHIYMGSAVLYQDPGTVRAEVAEGSAIEAARRSLAISLRTDLVANTSSSIDAGLEQETGSIRVAKEFTQSIENKISKVSLPGIKERTFSGVHPFTGDPIVIAIAWLDPTRTSAAKNAFQQSQDARVRFSDVAAYWEGKKQGVVDAADQAIERSNAEAEGYQDGRNPNQQAPSSPPQYGGGQAPQQDGRQSYGGGGSISIDGL
jgi:hypothetical protein